MSVINFECPYYVQRYKVNPDIWLAKNEGEKNGNILGKVTAQQHVSSISATKQSGT